MIFKQWFLITLALFSINAFAAAPEQWYNKTTITNVYAGSAGRRVAIIVNPPINSGNCTVGEGGAELELDPANPYFNNIFSMIITAYSTGKTISVYTNGTCANYGVQLNDVRLP